MSGYRQRSSDSKIQKMGDEGTTVYNIRLTKAEAHLIDQAVKFHGYRTRSAFMRDCILVHALEALSAIEEGGYDS